jgi:thiol-disulfide isomerase/thioredoxin
MDNQTELPATPTPEPPRRRTAMWVGMGAVLLALVLLTLMPQPEVDLNAPPPAANARAGALTGLPDDSAGEDAAFLGRPAPVNFTIKDMNGIDVNLASFKGKVVLLNFWATWCGPCKLEIPWLVALQEQYRGDLVVLGFSVDDTVEKMRPYATDMQINYPLLVGLGREDVQDAYGPLWALPLTVIIDRAGNISYRHTGIATQEEFDQAIQAAL